MKNNAETIFKNLVADAIRLPPQPGVILELQIALASDSYQVSDLVRIISSDPSITAMLFKAVRSSKSRNDQQFNSIEQIIREIGVEQIYDLVNALSISTSLSDSSRKSLESFWTRAQELANIAALIAADRVSVCNIFPDQAYMAGLFYECGVPVLMQRFPEYCRKFNIAATACWPQLIEEDALFNADHCSVGYLMARHWNLPDFICKTILSRHEIPRAELGAVRSLVAILQLALYLYYRINRTEYQPWRKIRMEVLTELGIHPEEEQEYYEEITEQFLN